MKKRGSRRILVSPRRDEDEITMRLRQARNAMATGGRGSDQGCQAALRDMLYAWEASGKSAGRASAMWPVYETFVHTCVKQTKAKRPRKRRRKR